MLMFVILQKYDFSSKSQPIFVGAEIAVTMFVILQKYDFSSKSQLHGHRFHLNRDVCDTAKVRFFKQITTLIRLLRLFKRMFVILQKYDFSSKSQR